MAIIYCYTCKENGKKYIGQTWNPGERTRQHFKKTYNTPFSRAAMKYGRDGFIYEILHKDILIQEELDALEKAEIQKHNTIYPKGYNLTDGGQQGGKWSDESRRHLSLVVSSTPRRQLTEEEKRIKAEKCKQKAIEQYADQEKRARVIAAIKKTHEKRKNKITEAKAEKLFRSINWQIRMSHAQRKSKSKPKIVNVPIRKCGRSVQCIETGEIFVDAQGAAIKYGARREDIYIACFYSEKKRLVKRNPPSVAGLHWRYVA